MIALKKICYENKERSEALDKFEIFKAEIENQQDLKIKIVRSGRGGEYYGRHTPYGQVTGPFARFLQKNGIVAQYFTPGEPQQNGVAERRNRTLMDMVRSMNYGQKDNPFLIIFACGAVQLILRYLIQTLKN